MRKTIVMFALLSLFAVASLAAADAGTVKVGGTVSDGKNPMAGVVVTDGLHFTFTDDKGHFSLDAPADARFVYLLTPRGYVADFSSGTPKFYQPIEQGKSQYDFRLQPMKGDPDKTVMLAGADPQIDTEHDIKRYFSETQPDMRDLLAKYPDRQQAALLAGDMSWDVYKNNADIKRYARELGIPFYPCIGNHDYDKYMTPAEGANYAHMYEQDFGPTYYCFQFGDAYYIILNDIKYSGNKGYTYSLDQGYQMQWLRGLLGMVLQQYNNIFVVMHAPLKPSPTSGFIEGGAELVSMLLNKPFYSAILSGHYHTNTVSNLGSEIYEYNIGAICGNMWGGNFSVDGTPNGYDVILADGKQWQLQRKSVGHDLDYQVEAYKPGVIADRPNDVCCKIWNWDDRWTVCWYEDGKPMGPMDRFYSYAPEYLAWLNGMQTNSDSNAHRTPHYFSAHPDEGAKEIKIEATDSFGNTFTATVKL